VKCCGEHRFSPFCPECGKKLKEPIADLALHLDKLVRAAERKLKRHADEKGEGGVYCREYKKQLERVKSWREAIDPLVPTGHEADSDEAITE
jgi:hypothetical protein